MLRGGLAGLGGRGGIGAVDPVAAPPVDWFGFFAKDQGGAFTAASTRVHLWGLTSMIGTQSPLAALTCDAIQGVGTGQMLYAIPHFFPRAGRITRLVQRTNGTTGVVGTPRLKMGIWTSGSLGGASVFAGTSYPAVRLAQSSDHNLFPGSANSLLSTTVDVPHDAGVYLWAGLVVNDQAVTNKHTILGLRRNGLFPILGFTLDATSPTSIAQDALTFGVGFRHAHTYDTTEDLPSTFPQTSPAALTTGAAVDTINVPALGFCWVPA